MFKTLMTSTALTIALAVPSFAYGDKDEDAALDTNMEQTFDAAETDIDTDSMADEIVTADMLNEETGLEQLSQFTGMTVDQIVGLSVMSADGEDVGEIDYIISNGAGYEAVIGIGGFLGLGEYTVALPLGNFAMIDGDLILDEATEEELNQMPEIDESELEGLEGDYVIS